MDYRDILKKVRHTKKITVSIMSEQMIHKVHPSAYSRMEKLNGHLSVEQYFDVCRVLGISGDEVFNEANRIKSIDELDLDRISSASNDWFSLDVVDDAMADGKEFNIYKGSVVWYQLTKQSPTELNNRLVVIEDETGKKHVRELICDFGRNTLKAWNSDYTSIAFQHPYNIVGIVKDINFRMNQ